MVLKIGFLEKCNCKKNAEMIKVFIYFFLLLLFWVFTQPWSPVPVIRVQTDAHNASWCQRTRVWQQTRPQIWWRKTFLSCQHLFSQAWTACLKTRAPQKPPNTMWSGSCNHTLARQHDSTATLDTAGGISSSPSRTSVKKCQIRRSEDIPWACVPPAGKRLLRCLSPVLYGIYPYQICIW